MKLKLTLMIFLPLFFISISIGQQITNLDLSEKEMLEDFEFLYKEFKSSYPYFGVNKRLNNVDWLSNKNEYEQRIKNSKTDLEFLDNLDKIISDLNNGHTDIYPTLFYDYFYNAYKGGLEESPNLKPYVDELEKTNVEKCAYWKSLIDQDGEETNENTDEEEQTNSPLEEDKNLHIQFDEENSLAMIQVASFSYDFIEKDAQRLSAFFEKVENYDNLIIDIRGNTGGDDSYWKEYIVPLLIKKEIKYPFVFAYKKSERILKFKPNYKNNSTFEEFGFENLPKELNNNQYAFYSDSDSVFPSEKGIAYKGNKYLLVDKLVYSSAESFAYFCKTSKFAQVVGETTGGDGIGTDPILLTLPNSGIVIRFTGEMALNADGSSNEEMKTEPDLKLENLKELKDIKEIFKEIKLDNNKN